MRRFTAITICIGIIAVVVPAALFSAAVSYRIQWLLPAAGVTLAVCVVAWLGAVARAWYIYGSLGLWLLCGAVLVLFWPFWYFLLIVSCATTNTCL